MEREIESGAVDAAERFLLCRVAGCVCAVPLAHVAEVLRPLAVEPLDGAPDAVLGVAVVRGAPVPVVDLARILGPRGAPAPGGAPSPPPPPPRRWVSLRTGTRRLVVAVGSVEGLSPPHLDAEALPPLVGAACAGAVEALGVLDADLLLVLRASRAVPDETWMRLEAQGADVASCAPRAPGAPE